MAADLATPEQDHTQDQAPASAPVLPARKTSETRFVLRAPLALERPEVVPSELEEDSLLPPLVELGFTWRALPQKGQGAGFRMDLNASFPRYSVFPMVGVAPSLDFDFGQVGLNLGLDIQDQKTLDKAPLAGSQFDTIVGSLGPRLDWTASPMVTLSLGARLIFVTETALGAFEGIETQIDHQSSYSISPAVQLHLPLQIDAVAQADIYSLGATGVASKEAAFAIPSQSDVTRWSLAVSKGFGGFGVEATYAFVTGVEDPIALVYQAPFLTKNYLLSPHTLTLGVSWTL